MDARPQVEHFLPLARSIASRLKRCYCWVDSEDLYSYALLGLSLAAAQYESDQGVAFADFAARKAMYLAIDEMRKDRVLSKAGTLPRRVVFSSELADDDTSPMSMTAVERRYDDHSRQMDLRDFFSTMRSKLCPWESLLLKLHYEKGLTFREIARRLGVGQPTLSMRHKRLLSKLRRFAQPCWC
ncbi:MAG: sigma-70 family RNA polymerase sigma factor [Planctomycetaceae bacterium]|nr:sigma-70 family RNA polymerase sigma factor [Planctomycetaceae bacterium]